MHGYSVSGLYRPTLIFPIAFLAILLCPAVNWCLSCFGLIGSIASSSVFFGLLAWIEWHGWKITWWRKLFRTPNLNGVWKISGTTSGADGVERHWEGAVTIVQTWSRLSIALRTGESISQSTVAGITTVHGQGCFLVYNFENRRLIKEKELIDHRGTCEVLFANDFKTASGLYFTNHDRRTTGQITWELMPERTSTQ